MQKFQPGRTVYILGRYRAKVIECGQFTVTCEVYEGLAPLERAPVTASYSLHLVEAELRE